MDEKIREALIQLNRQFYDEFASSFSATRSQPQAGVRRVADMLGTDIKILDLGCGNGQFMKYLQSQGFSGSYTGIDASASLLRDAASLFQPGQGMCASFLQADLSQLGWLDALGDQRFQVVTAFAVLHHIPGAEQRKILMTEMKNLLVNGGLFIFSTWQFQNSPKLMGRVLPWESLGLHGTDLEVGDTLLDWRAQSPAGQVGLRYVHLFSERELEALRLDCGFSLVESFYSDGKQGNLALYQVWQKNK